MLTVRDTGAGMTEEVKNHLFEPFFTTKGPDKGTGLGLAVVHGIVRDCEGHIEVESQPGRGTTFRIFLPMAAVPSGQSAPVATEEQASRGGAETILLVEDDAAVRALTSHILSARGYFVLEAANGVAGLRIARSYTSRIDLLANGHCDAGDQREAAGAGDARFASRDQGAVPFRLLRHFFPATRSRPPARST